jgi:Tol biopolymer transport system component
MFVRSLSFALAIALGAAATVDAATVVRRVQRVDAEPNGGSGSAIVSQDGRYIVMRSTATNIATQGVATGLVLLDMGTQQVRSLVPTANGGSDHPALSTNARFIAFESSATNIGDSTNGEGTDIIRLDRDSGQFRHANRALNNVGANAAAVSPAISGDGRYVVFTSYATNLVTPAPTGGLAHLYQMDFQTGAVTLLDKTAQGVYSTKDIAELEASAMSADGTRIVFTTQAENLATVNAGNVSDVLVLTRNLQTGAASFQNVNRSTQGAVGTLSSARGSISPNGRYVVFRSGAANITSPQSMSGLYLRDLDANTLTAVPLPVGSQTCDRAHVADTGQVVMQCSPMAPATAIQIFVATPGQPNPRLVSQNVVGFPANQSSANRFAIAADASVIAFESAATDLIAVDSNSSIDVFVSADSKRFDGLFIDSFE